MFISFRNENKLEPKKILTIVQGDWKFEKIMLYGLSPGRAYPIFIFIGFCTSNEGPYKMGTIIYRLFSQFFVLGYLSKILVDSVGNIQPH